MHTDFLLFKVHWFTSNMLKWGGGDRRVSIYWNKCFISAVYEWKHHALPSPNLLNIRLHLWTPEKGNCCNAWHYRTRSVCFSPKQNEQPLLSLLKKKKKTKPLNQRKLWPGSGPSPGERVFLMVEEGADKLCFFLLGLWCLKRGFYSNIIYMKKSYGLPGFQ